MMGTFKAWAIVYKDTEEIVETLEDECFCIYRSARNARLALWNKKKLKIIELEINRKTILK